MQQYIYAIECHHMHLDGYVINQTHDLKFPTDIYYFERLNYVCSVITVPVFKRDHTMFGWKSGHSASENTMPTRWKFVICQASLIGQYFIDVPTYWSVVEWL